MTTVNQTRVNIKTPWTVQDVPPQHGTVAVVTGTGGLGYECALALAGAGAAVVLAGRNPLKGHAAVERIQRAHEGASVRFLELDLASLASVQAFSAELRRTESKLDILINNAAVMALPKRKTTEDGFEMQFGTNHLGHFAVTLLLLPLLSAGTLPRITTVSSTANRIGRINFDDLQAERTYRPFGAYAQSKLANILFAAEFQRRADAAGLRLTSNSAHPGLAHTDIVANGFGADSVHARVVKRIGPMFSQTAADGALPILYAATAPEAHGFAYYGPKGLLERRGPVARAVITRRANNTADAAQLWELSEHLTGVRFQDSI